MREVWFNHVMVGVLKIGLACGIAQYIHVDAHEYPMITSLGRPFYYISYNMPSDFTPINPHWYAIVRTGIILVLFSLFEAGFLAAIGLLSTLLLRKTGSFQLAIGIMPRLLPILISLLFINETKIYNVGLLHGSGWQNWNQVVTSNEADNRLIALETAQVVATTQIDGGIMACTNLMRVWTPRGFFLVRGLVSVGIGMGINILMTIGVLWLAQKQAIRRGLSPPKRHAQGTVSPFKRLGLRV